jgi:endoglucanase
MLWDNGMDHFDRSARIWRDPAAKDILMNAVDGNINSLPDSTTDTTAIGQSSSAYIYHKVGESVSD